MKEYDVAQTLEPIGRIGAGVEVVLVDHYGTDEHGRKLFYIETYMNSATSPLETANESQLRLTRVLENGEHRLVSEDAAA